MIEPGQVGHAVRIGCGGTELYLSFHTAQQRDSLISTIGPNLKQAHGWVTVKDDTGMTYHFNTLNVTSISVPPSPGDKNQDHA